MPDLRKIAAEIEIRGRAEGVEELAEALKEVGVSAGAAGVAIGKAEKVTDSAERVAAQLERRYDKVASLEQRRAAEIAKLNRVVAAGTDLAAREVEFKQRINAEFDRQIEKTRRAAEAQDRLNDELKEGGRSADLFGRLTAGARKELDLVGRAGASLRGVFAGALAGISFAAIAAGAKDAIAALAELDDKARSLGSSAGFLQEARFALGQQGFDRAAADKALENLNLAGGQLDIGRGALSKVLPRLAGGDELARRIKDAKDLREQYELVIGALNKMPDAGQRAALAVAAFGEEAGKKIGAAAEEGVEGFRTLAAEARKAGVVIADDVIARAARLDDELAKASDIVGVQMKVAFAEIAPVIIGLINLTGQFLAGVATGLRNLRNDFADPAKLKSEAEAVAVKAKIEADIARARERQATLDRVSPGNLAGAGTEAEIGRLQQRLADVDAKLADIRKTAPEAGKAIADGMEAAGEKTGAAVSSLEEARKKLAEMQARLAAAKAGTLDAFDRKAGIDAAVTAGARTGAEAADLREVLEAQARVADETERAQRAAKAFAGELKTAKAEAAGVKIDPFAELEKNPQRLEQLLAAAEVGPAEVERARQRFEIEDRIARLKIEAARLAAEKDIAGVEARAKEIAKLSADIAGLAPTAGVAAVDAGVAPGAFDRVGAEFERGLVGASERAWDKFVSTGKISVREIAGDLKEALLSAASDPFRQLTAGASSWLSRQLFGAGVPADEAGVLAGTGGALAGLGSAAGGAFVGFSAGQSVSNLLGLKKGSNLRPIVTGAVGGAVGGAAAGTLAFTAAGAPLGAALGLGAAAGGPIGLAIGLIAGGLIALFGNKPSNKTGQLVFDPSTGATIGTGQKDFSDASNNNAKIASEIARDIASVTAAVVAVTGGKIADNAATAFREDLINVSAGNVRGIQIGFQGAAGEIAQEQKFENSEAGVKQAIEAGVRLALANLDTPFDAIDKYVAGALAKKLPIEEIGTGVEQLAALFKGIDELGGKAKDVVGRFVDLSLEAGKPVAGVVETAGRIAAAFESAREPVDVFAQRARDARDIFPPLIADMKALGDGAAGAAAELESLQKEVLDQIGKDRNDLSRQQLLGATNPGLASAEAFIKEALAARKGAEEAKAAGAPVDLALLNAAQRAQALAAFNLDARVAGAADPAAATLRQTAETQRNELAALKALIAAGFASQADLFRLETAQAGERAGVLRSLPQADQLRLSGSAEFREFETISGRVGVLLTGILGEFDRFEAGLDEFRDGLKSTVADGQRQVDDYNRFLLGLKGQGAPGTQLKDLRTAFDQTIERALGGDAAARAEATAIGQRLIDKSGEVNASSNVRSLDVARVEAGIAKLRDQRAGEVSTAQAQLNALDESVKIQREMRDLLARQDFDPLRFAELAAGLPGSDPLKALAVELAALKAQQAGIEARAAGLIAGTAPDDIFRRLSLLVPANDSAAPGAGIYAPAAAGVYAPQPAQSAANDAPVPFLAAARAPEAPRETPLAGAASATAIDDDFLMKMTALANTMLAAVDELRGIRKDNVSHTDKLSGQLGSIINNQVRKEL